MRIALIGDFSDSVTAHRAIPLALHSEACARSIEIAVEWLGTDHLTDPNALADYNGGWVVPASPYRSFDNALSAIRYLRENEIPFLGTCGGYQNALVEYAHNVLAHEVAGISEIEPDCVMPLVSPLFCALIDQSEPVLTEPGSLLATLCGHEMHETYRCNFGLNPDHAGIFDGSDFKAAARDPNGAVRAMVLDRHPFFVCTAFQPERAALKAQRHPIVSAFIDAATVRLGEAG